MDTQVRGTTTELLGILAFQKKGYYCSIPFDQSCRYDFVADVDGKMLRIQAKSSSLYKGDETSIIFSTSRQTTNTQKTVRYTYNKEEIDFFYTYYDGYDFLVPVEETSTSKVLRLSCPLNNQIAQVNIAADYLIDNVLESIINKRKIKRFVDTYIISFNPETQEQVEWGEKSLKEIYNQRQINYIKECCRMNKMGYNLIWKQKEFPKL